MEDKKENKTFIMVLIGIIGLCLITIGLTYAYWILTKQQTGENVVNTACLNINFTGENDITLDKAYPMKPDQLESFLSTATPYHFTIENTCNDLANATINLESLNAGVAKQLNDEYIDAILYESDYHSNLNSEKQLNESMYNDENKVISSSLHAYQLYNFVLQKGETKSFNLLLYMDPNTPMETANMNATWKGKITLSAGYKEEPTANLNGLIVPVVESGDGLYAVSHDVSEISTDWNQTEYRYAGLNPNNYVSFNNEKWQIIGLVNVQTDKGIEQRIKIIRPYTSWKEDFHDYYWDYNQLNDWNKSTLKDMLNGIYYEGKIGECYTYSGLEQCDFTENSNGIKGLNQTARDMIDSDVIWTLGGTAELNGLIKQWYEYERNTNVHEGNQFLWSNETDVGEKHNGIGLIYPSDFGYAVGGSIRDNCLRTEINNWRGINCIDEDWLENGDNWTLTPDLSTENYVFYIDEYGPVKWDTSNNDFSVYPTLYLKSSVKITPNPHQEQPYGTVDNPFQLSVQ